MSGQHGAQLAAATGAAATQGEALTIRRARADEYAAIDQLVTEAYAHDYGARESGGDPLHESAVRDRDFEVWVAASQTNELVGSVTLRKAGGPSLHEDVAEHELDLRLLGVSPGARRRGVGAALMRHAATVAAERGFAAVVLKTAPNMTGAHRLYESLGFDRTPARDGLWIGGNRIIDLYSYVLPVAPPAVAGAAVHESFGAAAAALVSADTSDPGVARGVLGRFPTGVVVVTGGAPGAARGAEVGAEAGREGAAASDAGGGVEPAALVLQSFVSLSIDPPRVLLSVGRASTSWPRIAAGGTFSATVLADDQGALARRIAHPGTASRRANKLLGVPVVPAPRLGHPVLVDGAAWFECSITEEFDGGDHRIVVADVLGFGHLPAAERPLVFAGSRFAGLR
ncbi:GNAT family N-acetyltransferase [Leucobacter albus]|uniref:GNAT family N-acetyltransferase n=1 Tax=Leucobacter albus TaxID=272210 RepID=A0ABW3TP55_9MICO